jgi:hypothetical protein
MCNRIWGSFSGIMKIKRGIVSSEGNAARGLTSSEKSFSFPLQNPPVEMQYLPFSYAKSLLPAKETVQESSGKSGHVSMAPVVFTNETFADILSLSIIDQLRSGRFQVDDRGCFPDSFYETCALNVSRRTDIFRDDEELLVIFAKQMMIMMKTAGVVNIVDGEAIYDSTNLTHDLLFDAFWNRVNWEDLFPSMPSTAVRMRDERYILAELLLSREGVFCVDDLARDYFVEKSVVFRDLLIYISFFDFSFFTWMRHFGIVEYVAHESGRVSAMLTPRGRHFLSSLS